MAGKKTVLLTTHILPEVESTCGRVLIIHRGRLVGEGAPGSLRAASAGQQVLSVEAHGERAKLEALLGAVPGVLRVADVTVLQSDPPLMRVRLEAEPGEVAEAVFRAASAAGVVLRELRREQASLEDVFTNLTTRDAALADEELEADAARVDAAKSDDADERDERDKKESV